MKTDFYVINLENMQSRMENYIIKNFSNDFNIIRVNAIKKKHGWQGCFLSHQKCIKIAKEKGLPYIIVLEDDTIPISSDFTNRFNNIKEYLDNNNNWDLFLGCGTLANKFRNNFTIFDKINIKDEELCIVNRIQTANFIIYNKSSYDFFLKIEQPTIIDTCWFDKLKAIIPVNFLVTQAVSYSTIEKKEVDYENYYQSFQTFLNNKKNNL